MALSVSLASLAATDDIRCPVNRALNRTSLHPFSETSTFAMYGATNCVVSPESLQPLSLITPTTSPFAFSSIIAVIAQRTDLDGATLARAIAATFARRGTALPTQVPTALTRVFGDDDAKGRQWQAFLNKSHIAGAAGSLPQTVALVHTLLWPATQVAGSGSNATAVWKAPERQWR